MRTRTAALLLRLPLGHGPLWRRALDTVWQAWLAAPDQALWALLERQGCAASGSDPSAHTLSRLALGDADVQLGPGLLAGTAARFDHPIGERARARLIAVNDAEAVDMLCRTALTSPRTAAFCVTHHLAPADEVERAVFFLRTGQHEQYQALDPDGALLALGYHSAPSEERKALLETVSEAGGADLLRVLAGRHSGPDGFAALGGTERRRLLEQFAARHDWDHWWALVQLMPLLDAVRAVKDVVDAAWRPSGEDDLRVFEALWGVGAAALEAWTGDGDGSSGLVPARITIPGLDGPDTFVRDMDFAPDGTQLAFAGHAGGRGRAGIIDLAGGRLSHRYPDAARPLARVAHLGADTLVVVDAEEAGDMNRPKHIHRFAPDGVRPTGFSATVVSALQRATAEGKFVVSSRHIDGYRWHARVSVGDRDGSLTDSGILGGLPDVSPRGVTVSPGGRRIAVVNGDTVVVADHGGTLVNVLDNGPRKITGSTPLSAMSDSVLVRADALGGLDIWHEPLVSDQAPVSRNVWLNTTSLYALAWSPALNRFLAVGRQHSRSMTLWVLDIPETRDSPLPDDLVARQIRLPGHPHRVRLSPKGDVLASLDSISRSPAVDLYYLPLLTLRSRVAGPMGLMSHQDLAEVTAAVKSPALDHKSRPILHALRSCLEHRFRHDMGIGRTAGATDAGDFEIELGEV
ncbi:hypothetical protein [Streptomyces sp. V4I2]|uniref:hypothetical protein n=1 Tax=Streptomyces sp. V4I2 TaxID=3042280 RepID=UPI0027D90C00|nr:hypothetical protein [Streptomyces sp. V4I2]